MPNPPPLAARPSPARDATAGPGRTHGPKLSPLQVHRNAETALEAAGDERVFSGKSWHEARMVTAQKGALWLQVKVEGWNEYSAVVAWLTTHGVAPAPLASPGLGGGKPVADNKTEAGRAKYRRVELVKR